MSKETAQVSVILGKTQVPEGAGTVEEVDEGKIPVSETPPLGGDVEGQTYHSDWTQCPRCWFIGWTNGLHTRHYVRVRCGRCYGIFWT